MTKLECDLGPISLELSPDAKDIATGAQVLRIGVEQDDQPLLLDGLERACGCKNDGTDRTGDVIP